MNTQLTMGPAPSTATIKALTLHQPWGTAMALGLKACETRSWSTGYRGLLAIHAGKVLDLSSLSGLTPEQRRSIHRGCILGVVDLIDCVRMTPATIAEATDLERRWGDWRPGRFAWVTRPVVWFREPFPVTGHQGLWGWDPPAGWRTR